VLLNEFSFHWFSNQAISFSPKKNEKNQAERKTAEVLSGRREEDFFGFLRCTSKRVIFEKGRKKKKKKMK